ncbi:hypothetical protein ABEB36_014632 [Hypothenemus hampei]|uniref:SWIM-type domain-containing protein n=1 Tax=Hypothenemus hampei TaxID=57062 RepID=A0ABD1E4G9_HYPHA
MASKYVIKLSNIISFFENDNNTIKKGENAFECSHVHQMQYDATLHTIRGDVQASMKNKNYKCEVKLSKNGGINEAKCSCPKGIKCHHIAALLLFGHYNLSVTDTICSWNAPKVKTDEVKTAEDWYPIKKYSALDAQLSEEELCALTTKLTVYGNTVGFTWLLQKGNSETDDELQNLLKT